MAMATGWAAGTIAAAVVFVLPLAIASLIFQTSYLTVLWVPAVGLVAGWPQYLFLGGPIFFLAIWLGASNKWQMAIAGAVANLIGLLLEPVFRVFPSLLSLFDSDASLALMMFGTPCAAVWGWGVGWVYFRLRPPPPKVVASVFE